MEVESRNRKIEFRLGNVIYEIPIRHPNGNVQWAIRIQIWNSKESLQLERYS